MKAIIFILLFAVNAQATQVWCLVNDFNTQCIYYSLNACQYAALTQQGVCMPQRRN